MLAGERGGYVCRVDVAEVSVPATVQAAIEARIDRLDTPAKRTLNAASVIGARFGAELLAALGIDAVVDELLSVELIDQVRFTPHAEYAFRHPLIRAVAYESQLKSDRAEWHRRLAGAIQERAPGSVEQNAALIAEHLEAAGELRAAYRWHMRAAAWSTNRDLDAARLSWERARRVADALPADDPDQLSMRIAPRTMLCATDWQGRAILESRGRFAELRELCSAAGDKVSLAIGMTGLATELGYAGRTGEGSRLASEQMALLESIGDPALTIGLAMIAFTNWCDAGEFGELLRWSQTVIDLADGDPTKGAGFGVGSPLAVALTFRGVARWWLGRPGWRQDLHHAVAMARSSNPATLAGVVTWTYGWAMHFGVLRADDSTVRAIEEAVQIAEATSNDVALLVAEYGLGGALLSRDAAADRHRGLAADRARPRYLAAQADWSTDVPDLRVVGRPGEGQARRARCCHCGDAQSRGRAAPGRTALPWRLGRRHSGGDAAGAWRGGRPGRSPRRDRPVGQPARRRRLGGARGHVAAAARAVDPGTRRCRGLHALPGSLPRHGENAWLRGAYRVGRGNAMTATGLVCGPCGTEPPPKRQVLQRERGAELPGPVDRLAAAPCSGSTGFLVIVWLRQPPSQNVGAVRPVISTTLQAALRQGLIKCCWWVCGRRALIHLMQNDGFFTGNPPYSFPSYSLPGE